MQKLRRKKFGEILIAEGIITHEQLRQGLEVQAQTGESIGEIMLRERVISESDIVRCVCTQYSLPFIRPSSYMFDRKLLDLFGPEFLVVHRICPLETIGSCAIVAVAEVPAPETEEEMREKIGKDLFYYFSSVTEVESVLREHFTLGAETMLELEEKRRARFRAPLPVALDGAPQAPEQAAIDPFDSSWESIFDEAEKNI